MFHPLSARFDKISEEINADKNFKYSTKLAEARWCASLRASPIDNNPHTFQHVGGESSDIYARERRVYQKDPQIVQKPSVFKLFPLSTAKPKRSERDLSFRRSVHFNELIVPPPLEEKKMVLQRSAQISPKDVSTLMVSDPWPMHLSNGLPTCCLCFSG